MQYTYTSQYTSHKSIQQSMLLLCWTFTLSTTEQQCSQTHLLSTSLAARHFSEYFEKCMLYVTNMLTKLLPATKWYGNVFGPICAYVCTVMLSRSEALRSLFVYTHQVYITKVIGTQVTGMKRHPSA